MGAASRVLDLINKPELMFGGDGRVGKQTNHPSYAARERGTKQRRIWATYNARSVYGREDTLRNLMLSQDIDFLVITEAFTRPADPPLGLFESTYSVPAENGRRGILLSIAPEAAEITRLARNLGGGNPNIAWVVTEDAGALTFTAGIYWPDNNRGKQADNAAQQLLEDVDNIPSTAHIVILGDFNYDPFERRGSNKAAMQLLLTCRRLSLVERSSDDCFTYFPPPPARKSHIDNFVVSTSLLSLICSPIFYLEVPEHERNPSDHVMIALATTPPRGKVRQRRRPAEQRYDLRCLLDRSSRPYSSLLTVLSEEWLETLKTIRADLIALNHPTSSSDMEVILNSIKFLIYSASYQTLPLARDGQDRSGEGSYMLTEALSSATTLEKWALIKRRLRAPKRGADEVPLQQLEHEMRTQAEAGPKSTHRSTRRWVAMMNRLIDEQTLPRLSEGELEQVTMRNESVLTHAIKKMRNNIAAGPDRIAAPQIKEAPRAFLKLLAFFSAWAGELGVFPTNIRLARMKYIPKKEKGKARGISLESLVSKLIEQCVAHPIFPAFGSPSTLIAAEQLANRRGISAEMMACVLAMIIEDSKGKPLLLAITDVKGAYPNLWREALWAKLADAHDNVCEVKQLRALNSSMSTQILEPGFTSREVKHKVGIPQGAPRSGDMFGFFNSDIPAELQQLGAGVAVRGVHTSCVSFLDDTCTPSRDHAVIRKVLQSLADYGDRWSQEWAHSKFKVLNIGSAECPKQWSFKDYWVDTVDQAKILGIIFHASRGWIPHFAEKLGVAAYVLRELRLAGFIGGRNPPSKCLTTVRAMVWAVLDHGRAVANLRDPRHGGIKAKLEKFHFKTLREVLGVSSKAPKLGVTGELGELTDIWRERQKQLLVAKQMLRAPHGSLPQRMADVARQGEAKLGIFRLAAEILNDQQAGIDISWFNSKRSIKKWVREWASKEWLQRAQASPSLGATYQDETSLETRGYLNYDFKGRQVLTKLRINDLDLGAAGFRGKAGSPPCCQLCGVEPETREHFLLRCRSLEEVRSLHPDALELTRGHSKPNEWRVLILAWPKGATEDEGRARKVGALAHDLWTARATALRLTNNYFLR